MQFNKEHKDVTSELDWAKFLKWLQESHQLSKLYTPDKYSVKLWKEFEDEVRQKPSSRH